VPHRASGGRRVGAGPHQFRFDEFIRLGLSARRDPRVVVADPHAHYFGTGLGEIRFEEWLGKSAPLTVHA
jgi:hypothetical protein